MSTVEEGPARAAILTLLESNPKLCPQFIRLAFYDAISYDPIAKVDGPHGLIRFWEGLAKDTKMNDALKKLDDLKIPSISNADLYQLAGVLAVEKAKGPPIDFEYGRVDSPRPIDPSSLQFISEEPLQDLVPNLVKKFQRIGLTDKEIVALSVAPYYWMNDTDGQSITDRSFYDFYKNLLKLESEVTNSKAKEEVSTSKGATTSGNQTTPSALHHWKGFFSNPSFYDHLKLFAEDTTTAGKEYASAHKKLCELGFKYYPRGTFPEVDHQSMKYGYIFAAALTILVGFAGLFFEGMKA